MCNESFGTFGCARQSTIRGSRSFAMKKILFAVSAVALALSAGSAMAADLPSRKDAAGLCSPAAPADVDRFLCRCERWRRLAETTAPTWHYEFDFRDSRSCGWRHQLPGPGLTGGIAALTGSAVAAATRAASSAAARSATTTNSAITSLWALRLTSRALRALSGPGSRTAFVDCAQRPRLFQATLRGGDRHRPIKLGLSWHVRGRVGYLVTPTC